jgi:hypothetical protein
VIRAAVLILALIPAFWEPARAEHEVYYRYVVLGYVKDAKGTPVASTHVELVRDKTEFSYLNETDAEGFFVLVARLGDESVGETLTLKIGEASARLIARFDPTNHTDARGTRVDLEGALFVERATWFPSTLARFLEAPAR